LKSGNLNLLETSGPVQGCNGIALPLSYRCKTAGLKLYGLKYVLIYKIQIKLLELNLSE
jgi:hypothetical protein